MKMTKHEALQEFAQLWAEVVHADPRARGDTVMKRETWNDWTDMLCKDRTITSKQYDTWTNPF